MPDRKPIFSCEKFNPYWWEDLREEDKKIILEAASRIANIKEFRIIADMLVTEIISDSFEDIEGWEEYKKKQGEVAGVINFFEKIRMMAEEHNRSKDKSDVFDKAEVI